MKMSETVKTYMLQGLDDMRHSIDVLDSSLFYLIVERVHLVVHLGACKLKQKIALERSMEREMQLSDIIKNVVSGELVSETFCELFFGKIYKYSLSIMEYMSSHDDLMHSYLEDFSERSVEDYRTLLGNLDHAICNILNYRFDVVNRVGVFKKQKQMPAVSMERWKKIIGEKRSMAMQSHIDPDFIESLFDIIHEESLRIEEERAV